MEKPNNRIETVDRLLRPKSIAVFGGQHAAETIRQCHRMGYPHPIWPIHPSKDEIEGLPCFRSVKDLPSAPDAAFIGVNRNQTIDIVKELAEQGAGGAVCYASGFKEADAEMGDGDELQQQLVNAAGTMPIMGPNCYGFINYLDGALLWPDQHGGQGEETGVAILTQSSNIAINLTMQKRALPISYVLAVGNQAQTGLSALASGLLDDPRVTAIGLHIEGIDDVAAFEAMLQKARKKHIPVVALKMGKSAAAQQLTFSHTASLAGSDTLISAFFDRVGVARVHSIPEFLETLKLVHVHGPLSGNNVSSMSCSGGEASLMADAAETREVNFRPLNESERFGVKQTLSDMVSVANPLDYHTFIWGDEDRLAATFSAMAGCGFDLSMLVLDIPRQDRCSTDAWDATLKAIKTAADQTGNCTAVVASMPENLPEKIARQLLTSGVAPMMGIDETLAAIEAAAFIGKHYAQVAAKPLVLLGINKQDDTALCLTRDESNSKALLSRFGVPVPASQLVDTPEQAASAAQAIGFPVVVKAVGEHLLHKTEMGAVKLNLADCNAVRVAAESMLHLKGQFLIEPMIEDAVAELIFGINSDPQFGLYLVIGAGGILVELVQDSRTLLLPVTANEVRNAILSLRSASLLTGFRGKPEADIDTAVDVALSLARFAEAHADTLIELDINPLMLRAVGHGAVAADAFIREIKGNPND